MIPAALIEQLRACQHLAILTGAGVSAESGIPTFRDALTGLWQRYSAEKLASLAGFSKDPALVWGWYEARRQTVLRAIPNPAHIAIAKLATYVPQVTLITQNVDDLHERAGSPEVIHLHGSLHHPRCVGCRRPYTFPDPIVYEDFEPIVEQRINPPFCTHCGALIRPGVVWFGEPLPVRAFSQAEAACQAADLLLVIGTSGMVYPAANLPILASRAGVHVAEINLTSHALNQADTHLDFSLIGKAGEIVPLLVDAAFG